MARLPIGHRSEDRLDAPNTLYYGDNLDILRNSIADASVDLIYLDPPFNSKRDYNVLFKEKSGEASPAQIEAFTDTWEWDRSAEATYAELVTTGPENVGKMIGALRGFLGTNDMMAYLVMMAARLVELRRVLKPTGSLYLHCDPTASHYLKVVLDTVFGRIAFSMRSPGSGPALTAMRSGGAPSPTQSCTTPRAKLGLGTLSTANTPVNI